MKAAKKRNTSKKLVEPANVGATVTYKGKTIKAKGAAGAVVIDAVAQSIPVGKKVADPKPVLTEKLTVKKYVGEVIPAEAQWEKAGDSNVMEAFFVNLADAYMAKATGHVKYDGKWYDLRTFKESRLSDGYVYELAEGVHDGVTLRVLI